MGLAEMRGQPVGRLVAVHAQRSPEPADDVPGRGDAADGQASKDRQEAGGELSPLLQVLLPVYVRENAIGDELVHPPLTRRDTITVLRQERLLALMVQPGEPDHVLVRAHR